MRHFTTSRRRTVRSDGIATLRIVARDVGALQVLIGASLLLPLTVSLIYGESYSALSFLVAAGVTVTCGALAYRLNREAREPGRRHALIIAGAGWLASAFFGALPFVLAAYWTPAEVARSFVPAGETYASSLLHFRNPLHAFFESMSAFTTTGLTMSVHEPSLGRGLLFYRSFAQWIGGAGVIVLSLAIIPRPRAVGSLELYQSESSGAKIRPNILGTARAIWRVYAGLTLLVAIFLFAATLVLLPDYGVGRTLFDAVNHAMTGLATGGFSPLDDSIAGYGSAAMEMVHLLPMILGAVSLPLYYIFLQKRSSSVFWRDPQCRTGVVFLGVLTPLVILALLDTPAVANPVREGLFQVVSGLSGTGWQTSAIGDWRDAAVLLLAWGAMVVSGSAGSTVGGIKLIRAYLVSRAVVWRVRRVFLPGDAVVPFRVGRRTLPTAEMHREVADAAVFSALYVLVLVGSSIVVALLAGPEFTLSDALFEAASAQGTVGLSSGITDPSMPVLIELVFILQMWIGRLEIFPVIVLLGALFTGLRRR